MNCRLGFSAQSVMFHDLGTFAGRATIEELTGVNSGVANLI
jgi:hypothetical protein